MASLHIAKAAKAGHYKFEELQDNPLKGYREHGTSSEETALGASVSWSDYLAGEDIFDDEGVASKAEEVSVVEITRSIGDVDVDVDVDVDFDFDFDDDKNSGMKEVHCSRKKRGNNTRGGKLLRNLGGSIKSVGKRLVIMGDKISPGELLHAESTLGSVYTTEDATIASVKSNSTATTKRSNFMSATGKLTRCFCSPSLKTEFDYITDLYKEGGVLTASLRSLAPYEYDLTALSMPASVGSI